MESGFYDIEDFKRPKRCQDNNHEAPKGIDVPEGKYYRHFCPSCHMETVIFDNAASIRSRVTKVG